MTGFVVRLQINIISMRTATLGLKKCTGHATIKHQIIAVCYRPLWLLGPLAFLAVPCANVCEPVVIVLPLAWGEDVPAETKAGVAEDRMRAGCMEPLAGIPGRGLITQKTMTESFQSCEQK